MLQLNLLPDVKKDYIKAKKLKSLILSVSFMASGASLAIVIILFIIVQFAQKKTINDLTKDISTGVTNLQSREDLNKILTIQHQLDTLPGLHEDKPEVSRIYSYLVKVTPAEVKISTFRIDLVENTLTIEGSAPSLASVNRYADTLKFTGFTATDIDSEEAAVPEDAEATSIAIQDLNLENTAFSNVLTESSRGEDKASYSIRLSFNPILFNNTKNVVLSIPQGITTRSTLAKPVLESDNNNDSNSLFEDNGGEQ